MLEFTGKHIYILHVAEGGLEHHMARTGKITCLPAYLKVPSSGVQRFHD